MITCSRCRSKGDKIVIHEIHSAPILEFAQNNDGTIDPVGERLDTKISPIRLIAMCVSCRKSWNIRRQKRQITDLPEHPDYQDRKAPQ